MVENKSNLRKIKHICEDNDNSVVLKFSPDDELDRVEFWSPDRKSGGIIVTITDLTEGLDKAGYNLTKR
jgi:hypothetical protein